MTPLIEILITTGDHQRPGASDAVIAEAEERLGVELPEDLRAFLRWSNGWDGEFGDGWLVLEDTDGLREANDEGFRVDFPGYVAIGGNGGLETYALDYRHGSEPEALVAIDRNSSDGRDIWPIGRTLTQSVVRLRTQPSGPWNRSPDAAEPGEDVG